VLDLKRNGVARRLGYLPRIVSVALLIGTLAAPRLPAEQEEPKRIVPPQRVLFVLIDTLRQDRIGAYGYPRSTSPSFDRLAEDGVLFTDCRSTSSWTKPAITSLFTGVSPIVHGVEKGGSAESSSAQVPALSEDFETLSETFLRNGFPTVGFCGNPHVVPQTGLTQGFVSLNQTGQFGSGLARDFIEWLHAPYVARPEELPRWVAHDENQLRPVSMRDLDLAKGVMAIQTESGIRLDIDPKVSDRICTTVPLGDVQASATTHVLGFSYTLGTNSSVVLRTPGHARVVKKPVGNLPAPTALFHQIPPGDGPLTLDVCMRGEGSGLEIADAFLLPEAVIRNAQGERWFVYLHLMNPHLPYAASAVHQQDFEAGLYGEAPRPLTPQAKSMLGDQAIRGTEDLRVYRARYDASIHEADAMLDAVVGELAKRSLLEDTLVVVTADHGEEFLDHGGMSHGNHPYEDQLRVPLLFYYPKGIATAKRVEGVTSLLDIYPTLVDLCAIAATVPFQGRSLVADLGPEDSPPASRSFLTTHTPMKPSATARADLLVRDGLKLIVSRDEAGVETVELFDLGKDPGETHNLAAAKPEDTARLRAELRATRAEHEALRDRLGAEPAEGVLSPEDVSALRSLGYID